MIKITTIISLLVLAGCHSTHGSGNGTTSTVAKTNTKDQVCEQSATTGSNLKKRRCMSRAVSDAVREQNQQDMRSLNRAQQVGAKDKR